MTLAGGGGLPRIGITLFTTDRTLPPKRLGAEVEGRGFDAIYLPEHSHIPVRRSTRWPGAQPGAEELPDYYWHLHDQIVALSMIGAVTTTLQLGTAVTLIPQHDPIWLAKQLATLDHLSGGRVVLGAGFAWNREELESHGVAFATRREATRDNVALMRSLWSDEVASFQGEHANLEPSWAYPKPAQQGGPPILLGGGWGPRLFEHLFGWADGWMPISARPSLSSRLNLLRAAAEEHRRDPSTLSITVMGAVEDPAGLENLGREGVDTAVLTVWEEDPDAVLRTLDRFAQLRSQLTGAS